MDDNLEKNLNTDLSENISNDISNNISENIINNKFLKFTDYFNQLQKQDKQFLSKYMMNGFLPNLYIYNNLIESVDFTEYISDIFYKNYIYSLLNGQKLRKRYREYIGKSKLCICTFPENINPIPIGHIVNTKNFSDRENLSDSDESLDLDAEILYIELDDDDKLNFNFITNNDINNKKYDDFINIDGDIIDF